MKLNNKYKNLKQENKKYNLNGGMYCCNIPNRKILYEQGKILVLRRQERNGRDR